MHCLSFFLGVHAHGTVPRNLNCSWLPVSMQVIDFELQRQLAPHMRDMQPLPGVFDPDFIAANQGARADHVVKGSKQVCLNSLPVGAVEWRLSGPWPQCCACCAFVTSTDVLQARPLRARIIALCQITCLPGVCCRASVLRQLSPSYESESPAYGMRSGVCFCTPLGALHVAALALTAQARLLMR